MPTKHISSLLHLDDHHLRVFLVTRTILSLRSYFGNGKSHGNPAGIVYKCWIFHGDGFVEDHAREKKKVLVVVAKSPEYDKWGYIDFRTNKLYIVVMIKCCENQQ
jgi:hypothetical protein